MKITRPQRLSVSRLVLALMLFAQAALAWSACDGFTRVPAPAVHAVADAAHSHESGDESDQTHCLSDRQALQKTTLEAPAIPVAPVLTLALRVDAVARVSQARSCLAVLGTGPPKRVRFQSFQL